MEEQSLGPAEWNSVFCQASKEKSIIGGLILAKRECFSRLEITALLSERKEQHALLHWWTVPPAGLREECQFTWQGNKGMYIHWPPFTPQPESEPANLLPDRLWCWKDPWLFVHVSQWNYRIFMALRLSLKMKVVMKRGRAFIPMEAVSNKKCQGKECQTCPLRDSSRKEAECSKYHCLCFRFSVSQDCWQWQ